MQKQVFVVFSTNRTGSSYISRVLNNHPNIRMHGELFNLSCFPGEDSFKSYCEKHNKLVSKLVFRKLVLRLVGRIPWLGTIYSPMARSYLSDLIDNPKHYFENNYISTHLNIRKKEWHNHVEKAVGFKLMYQHMKSVSFLRSWFDNQDIKVIFLKRENLLKQYLSDVTLVARFKNNYGVAHSDSPITQQKLRLDPNQVIRGIKIREKIFSEMQDLIQDKPAITITYESFFQDQDKTAREIFEFLELPMEKIHKPAMVKLTNDDLHEVILNYDEIKDALLNTPYGVMLEPGL